MIQFQDFNLRICALEELRICGKATIGIAQAKAFLEGRGEIQGQKAQKVAIAHLLRKLYFCANSKTSNPNWMDTLLGLIHSEIQMGTQHNLILWSKECNDKL
jgi:hypothetical protein